MLIYSNLSIIYVAILQYCTIYHLCYCKVLYVCYNTTILVSIIYVTTQYWYPSSMLLHSTGIHHLCYYTVLVSIIYVTSTQYCINHLCGNKDQKRPVFFVVMIPYYHHTTWSCGVRPGELTGPGGLVRLLPDPPVG